MINMSKLHFLITVSMTVAFTQGHRVTRKLELVQSFCCKVAVAQILTVVDCVREITSKKTCKYGDYGSFEHLLFLYFCVSGHVVQFDVIICPVIGLAVQHNVIICSASQLFEHDIVCPVSQAVQRDLIICHVHCCPANVIISPVSQALPSSMSEGSQLMI